MAGTIDFAGSSNDGDLAGGASSTQVNEGSISGSGVLTSPAKGNEQSQGMNSLPENYQGPTREGSKGEVYFAGDNHAGV